jgi:hypothetical protein
VTTFALVRVLGNDMPPLHSETQTLDNLRFLLEHEPALEGCTKHFILNRIADEDRFEELRRILEAAGHVPDVIPFDEDEYSALESAEERSFYLTNNNSARNRALELGRARADVVLPFDGQIFVPLGGWAELRAAALAHPDCPAFVVPMARLLDNAEALSSERVRREEERGPSEPQLAFGRTFTDRFDESIPYGRGPKIDLLMRLGVAGPWDEWRKPYWVQMRARPRSVLAGQARTAGWVYRLAAGNEAAVTRIDDRQRARMQGVQNLVAWLDEVLGI